MMNENPQDAPKPADPPPAGTTPATAATVDTLLGTPADAAAWRRPWLWIAALALLAAAGGAWWWQAAARKAAQPHYLTEPVARGRLVVTVTANGTLQPTNKVDIGSELSGTVAHVLVDINDRVRKNQLLAELDTAKLDDQLKRSQAALAVAQARVQQVDATVVEAQGSLARLQAVQRLSAGQLPSQADLAGAQAAADRARADATSARANVDDARAALSVDTTNLRKASIRSPIDGLVLSRSVDPGNAVAASLQAVTLFTLAEDLSRMKLQVNVDEADVGQVHQGQSAQFSVSAWPNRQYPATITRVGYGSTTKDNVVTYIAELSVANDDLSLRPGMTATAVITASTHDQVLLVPNTALRFSPVFAAAPAASESSGGLVSRLVPRMPRQAARRAGGNAAASRQVWVLQDGGAVPVNVTPGASDGRQTEVTSDRLQPGMAVIVDQTTATNGRP